ncbi:MAG TPA: efflux RND transporter permease subunit [Gemmataceae bacterium]|nr:efflux RND transporter permease subunit [Gemmataceae bacterium]
MWIVKLSLKNPHAIAVLAIIICVLGALAVSAIPVDILPVFKAPAVQVLTFYNGMPPNQIDKTITNRIERWTSQAAGCKLVESQSTQGVSVVRLYFRDDIDPNGALTQSNSLALATLWALPPNTLPPVVMPFDPTGTLPLGVLAIRGPSDMSETQLQDIGRYEVRNMLGSVPGAIAPAAFGGKQRTVLIYVDPVKLEARKLAPKDVVDALSRSNFMVSPGVAKFGPYEFQLDSNAMVKSVADLNDIPLRIEPGNAIYLRDVGVAVDGNAIQTAMVRINGKRQVYVPVYRQQGASSLAVVDGVKDTIPYMEERLAKDGIKLDLVMDQSDYVRKAIEALIHEGVIGAVLVAVMILIFLGNFRMTLIASMSIPLAVLTAIVGLYATGNTINAMTLGGLALAIGPLVDDAIVVLENTHRHHGLGKSKMKAAFDGAVEVTLPVLVATMTTIIVLCPVAFMPGMGGFLFKPLTMAVAFAMLASFLLSRTFVPVLCARWLGSHNHAHGELTWGQRLHQPIDNGLHWVTRQYSRLLAAALRHRVLVLTGVGVLFIASLALLFRIGREFFPQVDAGQITIQVRAPSGTNIEENERRIVELETFLKKMIPRNERQMIIAELGLVPDWSAAYSANSGSMDTTVKIQLTDERTLSAQEYAARLRHALAAESQFSDLRFSFNTGGMISAALNYGATSPINIQIEGGSTTDGMLMAQRIVERIRKLKGAADVHVKQRLDAPQRIIVVNRIKAADVGLSEQDVMTQVVTAMNSSVSVSRNFWIDSKTGNQYFVAVQYPENADLKLQDILNIVATGTKAPYPVKLGDLIRLEYASGAVEINHTSLSRTFDVQINTERRDIGSLAAEIAKEVPELENPPPGMRLKLSGEYSRMQESFGSLGIGLALASILVYLLLVVLFRSFLGPFIIMFAVPLGLIGVLWMLFLTRTTLNVQSSMGVIFMVGIVVANSVLLVDFANKQRALGASVYDAITTAAAIRLRPILMTFLATFLDLLPMAIGIGRGSEANMPLARAVVGGLLTSTFLTLIVVPIMYTLLNRGATRTGIDIDAELADVPAGGTIEAPGS